MSKHRQSFTIESKHPAFSGHFANDPIVPAVIILENVLLQWQACNAARINTIDYAKFLNPLRADIRCYIDFKETKSALKKEFVVKTKEELLICKGRLVHD